MNSKHILAIGFKPGDIEISCGAVLAALRANDNPVTIVHLTDGANNFSDSDNGKYYSQSQIEAKEAAHIINATVIFGNYHSYELQDNKEVTLFITNIIRKTCPTSIITHRGRNLDQSFNNVQKIIVDAISLSESHNIELKYPPYQGIKGLYFTEHLTNKDDFDPYIYVNITNYMDTWHKMINCFEYFKQETAYYPYIKYYSALAKIRGVESYFDYACAFDISTQWKKQYNDLIP